MDGFKRNFASAVVLLAIVAIFLIYKACTFTVHEREQVVITRLNAPIAVVVRDMPDEEFEALRGRINATAQRAESIDAVQVSESLRVRRGAGLYFKLPFIDEVHKFPSTVLEVDAEPSPLLLADKKTLKVDSFGRWRIEDPLRFYVSVRTERNARDRLDDIIYSATLEELGQRTLSEVSRTTNRFVDQPSAIEEELAGLDEIEVVPELEMEGEAPAPTDNPLWEVIDVGRDDVMRAITERSDARVRDLGVRVLDVRLKRADLMDENLQAVFGRMQAERSRISRGYRSDGRKQADIIEGNADRQVQIILAEAQRDAEQLRGEGDAEAVALIARAFGANPELYQFIRSLDILREATPEGSELVIGLESSIYQLIRMDAAR